LGHSMAFAIARIIAIILLFWALDRHSYGYYTLIRFVTCGVTAYGAYFAVEFEKKWWAWALGIIAVLFNPLVPVHLDRGTWAIIDIGAAILLLVSLFVLKKPAISGAASLNKTNQNELAYDDFDEYLEDTDEEEMTEIEDQEEIEFARKQDLEEEALFWQAKVEEKEKQVSDLSVEIQELKIKLNIFESEYNARVGVLYVKLDRINLGIQEYELRIEVAKEGRLSTGVLRDIEDEVRDTFFEEREKINNLEDEAFESSQEYERHLQQEKEKRLDEESEQELKRLFRELAKKYHPDKASNKKQSEEYQKIMAEINEAHKAKDIEKLE
jgi:hypothetical protein